MISYFNGNLLTKELILKFNQHSYNYLFSTLKNAIYPNYRNQELPEMDNLSLINCMKLFAIIYYRVENNTSELVESTYTDISDRFNKVHEGLIKSWLEDLEKAAFIFVNYGEDSFSAKWNKENVWIKKAIGFKDNGKYNYFKYSTYPVCSIAVPEEMNNIELVYKYIKVAIDLICNKLLNSVRYKDEAIFKILEATSAWPHFHYEKDATSICYLESLLESIEKVLKTCLPQKETT